MTSALLFERDEVEEVENWQERIPRIGRSSILWIDLEEPSQQELRRLVEQLDLTKESHSQITDEDRRPRLDDHGTYLHVTAFGISDRHTRQRVRVDCLVSKRWLVTVHDSPLEVVESFRERATGSGDTGRLDGLEFLANLVEWVLTSYLDAFEEIEHALEEIETRAMRGKISSTDDALGELVNLRQEIGRLRRALGSHRELLLSLARPEHEAITSSDAAERFTSLRERLEETVQAARDSRESVVGSFDVLIASTAQRTNEIMKVLTLASVLLLPGALIAGIMGMNFRVAFFEHEELFWLVIAGIVGIAFVTLAIVRARRWI